MLLIRCASQRIALQASIDAKEGNDQTRYALEVMARLKTSEDPAGLLASKNGDSAFAGWVFSRLYQTAAPQVEELLPHKERTQRDILYRFIAGGCGALMTNWVQGEINCSAEELISQMNALSLKLVSQ